MKNSPITNILGILFLSLCLFIYIFPIFTDVKKDYTEDAWYVPLIFLVIGVSFLLIPDELIKGLGKLINKKADTL